MKAQLLRLVLILPVLLLSPIHSHAGSLSWESTMKQIHSAKGDSQVSANFVFTNTSSAPVEVGQVKTSCSCTKAEVGKKTYQPGESGAVSVVFAIGNRKGIQEKTILVSTGKSDNDMLKLRVHIPDSFSVDKEALTWKVGETPQAKTFEIIILEPGATIKTVKPVGKNFEARLKEAEAGKKYEIQVWPQDTTQPAKGSIRFEISDPGTRAIYLPLEVIKI